MVEQDMKRKLATIMVADIVGFSRLTAQDEDWTIRVLGEFRGVVDRIIERHDGRIFNTGGDSVLAEFDSPVEAVRCAVDFQEAARSRNLLQARDRQLRFRIGLNLGDVLVRGNDLLGDGVNVAARLEGLTEPGGICVSGTVWDHINGKLSLGYVDIGEQTVKNIPRPIRAYRLRVDGGVDPVNPEAAAAAVPASLAIAADKRKRNVVVPLVACALAAFVLVIGSTVWLLWPGHSPSPAAADPAAAVPLPKALAARLVSTAPGTSEKGREDGVRSYAAAAAHKAVAVEMGGSHFTWVWNRLSREEAVDSALESCQVTIGRPCVLVAVDDRVLAAPATGNWTPRDMPRARYSGNFDPAEIPAVYQAIRARDDVVGYRLARAAKAAAFHPVHVRLFIAANAANQHAAELQALAACNTDPLRAGVGGPCFLYATGNRVVLPLRLREPMTAE